MRFSITQSLKSDSCCCSCFFLQKLQCTENVRLQQQQDLHLFIPNWIKDKSHSTELTASDILDVFLSFWNAIDAFSSFLSNTVAYRSRSESLCGSHKHVPTWKISIMNLSCLSLWLQPVQKSVSGMVWHGYTQPSVLSSLLCLQCLSLSLPGLQR